MNQSNSYVLFLVILGLSFQETKAQSNLNNGYTPNQGQIRDQNYNFNQEVCYQFSGTFFNLQLKRDGFSYEIYQQLSESYDPNQPDSVKKSVAIAAERIDIHFLHCNPELKLSHESPFPDYRNFYHDIARPVEKVYSYEKVIYSNLYPGIDLEFILDNKGMPKYNFIVHPGADPAQIAWIYGSANEVYLENQVICLETERGLLKEEIPYSYLQNAGMQGLEVRYQVKNDVFSFNVAKYAQEETLVIDPRPWATYLGGSGEEFAYAIGRDKNENVFAAGETWSTFNIATSGTYLNQLTAGWDAFIVKYNAKGLRIWGTYYGGESNEECTALVLDTNGNSAITGQTLSQFGISTNNSYQSYFYGGLSDVYIAQFDSNGLLNWATYFGGNGQDRSLGLCIDDSLNIYVTGQTESTEGISTAGAFQPNLTYHMDAFLAKFSSNGTIQWATYIGGSSSDYSRSVTYNPGDGMMYIAGYTSSSGGIATSGVYQPSKNSVNDGFLIKFDKGGQRIWGTFYGGNNSDYIYDVCADLAGNVYLTGMTNSNLYILTPGCYQSSQNSWDEMCIAKFTSNGAICWSTYYGGDGTEYGRNIAVTPSGKLILTGHTTSSTNFVSQFAYRNDHQNSTDAFLLSFDTSGQMNWCTYVGGPNEEQGYGLSIGGQGQIYFSGFTRSNTSIITPGAFQPSLLGGHDALVAYYSYDGYLDRIDSNTLNPPVSSCIDKGDTLSGHLPYSNWKEFHYQWIASTQDSLQQFTPVSAADTLPYLILDSLTTTTYFKRVVFSGPMRDTSNVLVVFAKPKAKIYTHSDTLCEGMETEFRDSSYYSDPSLLKLQWWMDSVLIGNNPTLLPGLLSSGHHSLALRVETPHGCIDSTVITPFIAKRPEAVLYTPRLGLCQYEGFEIQNYSSSLNDPIVIYYWDFNDGKTDSLPGPVLHQYDQPGYYYPQLIVETKNHCRDTANLNIVITPTPEIIGNISSESVCFGTEILLLDSSTISDQSPLKSFWLFGDNTLDSGIQTNKNYLNPGLYHLRHYILASTGCADSMAWTVLVHPLPHRDSISGPPTQEKPSQLSTYFVPHQSNTLFTWDIVNGVLSSEQERDSVQVVWLSNGPGEIHLLMENQWGCQDSVKKYIQVCDTPFIISFYPTHGSQGDSIYIYGFNFYSTFSVQFGGAEAGTFSVLSDNEILAILDTGATGEVTLFNLQGQAFKAGFTYQKPSSVYSPARTFQVYPNPVNNFLYINYPDWSEPYAYQIFTVYGQLIKKGALNSGQENISLEFLKPGVYWLFLDPPSGTLMRIIKK